MIKPQIPKLWVVGSSPAADTIFLYLRLCRVSYLHYATVAFLHYAGVAFIAGFVSAVGFIFSFRVENEVSVT